MFFILFFSLMAEAEFVDSNGRFLFDTIEGCKKYHDVCYETDSEFDKEFYVLKEGKYVKDKSLEAKIKNSRKYNEDKKISELEEIYALSQKPSDHKFTSEEVEKILRYLIKNIGLANKEIKK